MDISFFWMRRIDTLLGRPLLWFLGFFTKKPKSLNGDFQLQSVPRRVICTKFIGLGSVVLSLPLLKELKDAGVKVAFWSFPGQAELVKLSGLADEVWIIRPTLLNFLSTFWVSLRAARHFKADAFLDLEPTSNFSATLARISGARVRIGFMSSKPFREKIFTHLVSYTSERHVIENYLLMTRYLNVENSSRAHKSPLPPAPELRADFFQDRANRKHIVLNVNAGDLSWQRMWTDESWVHLARDLLKDSSIDLVFPGSPAESKRVQRIIKSLPRDRVMNLAGKTSLAQLLQILRKSDLVVSVDSGIMHLAAWAGAPVVGLFGPETPTLYAPRGQPERVRVLSAHLPCSPCLVVAADKITNCKENRCMKKISPESVYEACQKLLISFGENNGIQKAG